MFDKKCPKCGGELLRGIRHVLEHRHKCLICEICGYSEPFETSEPFEPTAEKIKRMDAASELLMQHPVQGVSLVEQMANEVIMQKEKDITKAIVRSCVSVGVDPDALVKTAQLNQNLQSELKALAERFAWVPCSERLPEKDGDYLVVMKSPMTGYKYHNLLFYYTGKDFYTGNSMVVTHWMELPELPEEDKVDE